MTRSHRWIAVTTLALALAACGDDAGDTPAPVDETPELTAEPTPEPGEPEPPAPRDVHLTTEDGIDIVATLAPSGNPDAGAVVLVHQLGSDRHSWDELVTRLHARPALTTIAIDMRGHGESTHGPNGMLIYGEFDAAAWAGTANDVRAAAAYLSTEESGVHPAHVLAIGSSIGCTAVLVAAANEPSIEHLVLLSPGRAYHGFDAIVPASQLRDRGLLTIVAADETDNVETARAIGRVLGADPFVVPGDAHGLALLESSPETFDRVEEFIRRSLGAQRSDAGSVRDRTSYRATHPPAE